MRRRQPGRHDLRGRGALAARRIITATRPLLGEVDLAGSAAELRVGLGLDDLPSEAVRRGLHLLASLSPLVRRRGRGWHIPLRTAWERGVAEVGVFGHPRDGAAVGAAVGRWVRGPAEDTGRPLLAAWRRALLARVPERFGGVRAVVELLAAHPVAARGDTSWQAARALLEVAGEVAAHASLKRAAGALEYLRKHGHLDAETWRPAADIERHPALEHPLDEDTVGLESPSPRLCYRLELSGVPRPGQLSRAEARRVWARSRPLRPRSSRLSPEQLAEWIDDGYLRPEPEPESQEIARWLAAG